MGRALSSAESKRVAKLLAARVESFLDSGAGACHLGRTGIASVLATTMRRLDGTRYTLFAWCIMPNNVHAVLQPLGDYSLANILHSWKSYTVRAANRFLGRSGGFWQREYYDHLIRDGREFTRILRYVAENPLKAGLRNWPWVEVRIQG